MSITTLVVSSLNLWTGNFPGYGIFPDFGNPGKTGPGFPVNYAKKLICEVLENVLNVHLPWSDTGPWQYLPDQNNL